MSAPGSPSEATLTPRVQRWLQLAWLILIVPVAALYFVGVVQSWSGPTSICAAFGPDCTEAAATAELARIGLSPLTANIIAGLVFDLGVPLGCLLIGAFIFLRRPDRLITLAISAMLVLYGPVINTSFIDEGLSTLGLSGLANLYHAAFQILLWVVIFTFPTGRFVPRWSGWVLALGLLLFSAAYMFATPDTLRPFLPVMALLGIGFQIYRYLRVSNAVERQQTRWVLVGFLAFVLNILIYSLVVDPQVSAGVGGLPYLIIFAPINGVLVLSLPATLLVASLRYRLWEIDVIIRRTLIYSVVTALLVLIYLTAVIGLQALFQFATGAQQGTLVTVLSTLVIAALFGPLRTRVQAAIDQRFYRRTYDAAKIISAFGVTLRAELELDRVVAQLVNVVDVALQPANSHVWLKPPSSDTRLHE